MNHRWSGWPGAWCLDCGRDDPVEIAIADGKVDGEGNLLPGALSGDDKAPCPEPGSNRFNPYVSKQLTEEGDA
jgi:hypothetical protein